MLFTMRYVGPSCLCVLDFVCALMSTTGERRHSLCLTLCQLSLSRTIVLTAMPTEGILWTRFTWGIIYLSLNTGRNTQRMQPVSQTHRVVNIPALSRLWREEQTGNLHINIGEMMQDTMQTGGLKWNRGAMEGRGITTPRRFNLSPQPQINIWEI